jgi:hypothetical protein
MLGYEDSFGKLIADTTRDVIDIGSHYPYSPERWRLLVDGTRQFPEYGSVAEYQHLGDVHELSPSSGSTVIFETNELLTYVVQYELLASAAWSLSQALQSGDRFRWGVFNDNDGWFLEQNSGHGPLEADLVIRRDGSDVRRTTKSLDKPLTTFARYSTRYSWYNVGPAVWDQFYTLNGARNHRIGSVSVDDGGRGPKQGNLPIRFEITAGGSTSGLKLNAGSLGAVTLGNSTIINRVKGADFIDNLGSTGAWVPIRAFRLIPAKDIVPVRLTALDVLNFSANDDVRLLAQIMPQEKVSFGGGDSWGVPPEWLEQNNALETRTDVSSIPADDGTTSATVTNPGGYQINRSMLLQGGGGQNSYRYDAGGDQVQKRKIPQKDYLVILAKSGSTGDITYDLVSEQDW